LTQVLSFLEHEYLFRYYEQPNGLTAEGYWFDVRWCKILKRALREKQTPILWVSRRSFLDNKAAGWWRWPFISI